MSQSLETASYQGGDSEGQASPRNGCFVPLLSFIGKLASL